MARYPAGWLSFVLLALLWPAFKVILDLVRIFMVAESKRLQLPMPQLLSFSGAIFPAVGPVFAGQPGSCYYLSCLVW